MRSRLLSVRLTDFRSYGLAHLETDGRSVFLHGPNGAGKTNLLEAISLLSPGRGLRGGLASGSGPARRRRDARDALGRWPPGSPATAGETRVGTGLDPGSVRDARCASTARASRPPRSAEHLRPLWLTPAQDRLFLDAASDRRRFFDRLVFAAHAEPRGQRRRL